MANKKVRIGVIGTGSWANYGHMAVYQQHPQVKLVGVCDIDPLRAEESAKTFGAQFTTTDFTELVERNDIDAIDIVTPNVAHAPIALAAMEAGKHVMCEKPLAMSYHQARDMARVAQDTGVKNGINFVYRHHPAAQYARHLIKKGYIGRIFQINAAYMQGFLIDPAVPLVWRLQKDMTGTGVLGDLGSHIIDLVEWLTDQQIVYLVSDMQTFIHQRPLVDGSGVGQVDVDDSTTFLTRFNGGAMGTFVSSRYATARGNYQRIEIYGDQGALVYRWEDTDHLKASIGPAFVNEAQWASIPIPDRFKAISGEKSSKYNFTQNLKNFIQSIIDDREMQPNFQDGLRNQEILEAVEISARDHRWIDLPLEV